MKLTLILVFLLSSLHLCALPPEGSNVGFSTMPAIFDQHIFDKYADTSNDSNRLKGEVVVNLESVTQFMHLYNASHFAILGPNTNDDTRFLSLAPVLKKKLTFTTSWPTYGNPTHVVLLKAGDGNWILVANMGDYFVLETEHGFGIVRR